MIESTNETVPSAQESSITCHLANNDADYLGREQTYYSSIKAKVKATEENCITECHSHCQICWTDDNCEPICSEDRKLTVEGFKTSELDCQRPFYFCNRGITRYEYKVNKGLKNEETRVKHFIGMYIYYNSI